jgi:hypothetical protein
MGLLKDVVDEGWFKKKKVGSISLCARSWEELLQTKTIFVIALTGEIFQISVPEGRAVSSLTHEDLSVVQLPYVPKGRTLRSEGARS